MTNTVILGVGRSGTSMVAAFFRNACDSYGGTMIGASPENPYGYYEATEVNQINNDILSLLLFPRGTYRLSRLLYPEHYYDWRTYWLINPPRRQAIYPRKLQARFREVLHNKPFCLKDPRFNATLDSWMPYFPDDIKFIVVFRNYLTTINSIFQFMETRYATRVAISQKHLLKHWEISYRHLIHYASRNRSNFFFLNTDDLTMIPQGAIENFVGCTLDLTQLDQGVRKADCRPAGLRRLELRCRKVYGNLRHLASEDARRYTFTL